MITVIDRVGVLSGVGVGVVGGVVSTVRHMEAPRVGVGVRGLGGSPL